MTVIVMELAIETPDDSFNTFIRQKLEELCPPTPSCQLTEENDIIDSSKLNFNDDENWLCECYKTETNLQRWLYDPNDEPLPSKPTPKNIDTRTFTRPKKRFTRPSIEKYNEEWYGNELRELTDSGIQLNGCSQDDTSTKPLHFDLGQTSSVYFENILANAPMMDSFQNMSPPSLVNSMCSSTFANLMESSFIKNDPVLREIRDTDYTGSILQQESEPMFQSITESYSSLNSDVPENFLKKVSFGEKNSSQNEDLDNTLVLNATFAKQNDALADETISILAPCEDDPQEPKTRSYEHLNSTYQRKPKSTKEPETPLNSTFQRRKSNKLSIVHKQEPPRPNLNSTITVDSEKSQSRDDRTIETIKRLLDRRPSPSLDLNRLSYLVDKNDQMNATFTTEIPKRNSFGSTDSGENLDYMSLSSGSSKSSTKVLSTDGINVIVEAQGRSNRSLSHTDVSFNAKSTDLHQVMSTPNHRIKTPFLFQNHEISPIGDRNSDPELSSNEQPPRSVIPQNSIRKQKSAGHINQKIPNARSLHTFEKNTMRGSHPNLKMTEPRTFGLQRPSNLNSMGHTLKGSYTSLKPMNPNLPVAPPPLNTTLTVTKHPAVAQFKVPPVPREVPLKSQDAQFVKPQPPKSGLPRPVTGIPRPVSRIPGPRNIRPVSKSAGYQGRY